MGLQFVKSLLTPVKKLDNRLFEDLANAQNEMNQATADFQYATDPSLIDSCIYRFNAAQMRYQYILGQIRRETHYISSRPVQASLPLPKPVLNVN